MAGVNTSGLKRFISKVSKYRHMENLADEIAEKVAERGVEIAREKYFATNVEITNQSSEIKGQRRIIVKGKGLAFLEFGTGLVGKGTYPDESKLPKETISFESPKGVPQSTDGWQYYYPNPKTKKDGGWYAGKVFHRGQTAGAQMFDTAQQLRAEMGDIGKEKIKEAIKK